MATLFLQYPACSTCQKAKKWLTENNIEFTNRLIIEENASYIRVRNITLGYNLGPKELSVFKGYIRGIRVFVDFQNPLTFTKYKGYDPEINTSSSNLTGGQYPQMRVYSIGAKLTF